MAQLLAAVESQRQAIKESIENDGPCSEVNLRPIHDLLLPPNAPTSIDKYLATIPPVSLPLA